MSYFSRKILSIIEPTIKLESLVRPQTDSDLDKNAIENLTPNIIKTRTSVNEGGLFPVVFLKKYMIPYAYLKDFTINTYSDIPEIEFSFDDVAGVFETEIPMDGDEISIYIRPSDIENLKPMRIDFDIMSIIPFYTDNINSYSIRGIMKIPGFFNDICKAFKENTSFEQLQDVCELVGLGFASNDVGTNDSMLRICPYTPLKKFVDDITKTAYKDDKSFFKWFIDPYYYLCFVNVNKQLSTKIEPDTININRSYPSDVLYLEKDTDVPQEGKLILTNKREFVGSNLYIKKWTVSGEHGRWLKDGYFVNPIIYDIDTKTNKDEKIQYHTTAEFEKGAEENFVLQKGKRGSDFYKTQIKYHWLGKQEGVSIGGNVHDSYIYSKILNSLNESELKKINLEIELTGVNFYIQKYMMIPIEIYEIKDETGHWKDKRFKKRDELIGDSDNIKTTNDSKNEKNESDSNTYDGRKEYLNKYLSGYYLVRGIKYIYTKGGIIKMYINLTRREHNIPAENNYDLIKE